MSSWVSEQISLIRRPVCVVVASKARSRRPVLVVGVWCGVVARVFGGWAEGVVGELDRIVTGLVSSELVEVIRASSM